MKIGITYDLRDDYLTQGYGEEETAEFDRADTIDAIDRALRELGYRTERIGHLKALVARLVAGDRWDLVFNIAEGLHGIGREAQVPAMLDAYQIPYTFSDPLVLSLTLDKAMTKRIVRDVGLPTPDFTVVRELSDLEQVRVPLPLFAKPLAEGTGKGVNAASRVTTRDGLARVCRDLLERFRQPVLLETFLPGREFTVGIIGTGAAARAVGVMEVLLQDAAEQGAYSYSNKKNYTEVVRYRLADDPTAQRAADIALEAWNALGCRDAGRIDLRSDADGEPNFIEVNPLAGLHPEHSDLPILCKMVGIEFRDLIEGVMTSALKRRGP
ncbi:MAG: ATP-grasp domain-containing protein [Desulfobacterales bacterium]|nr:ATP-grasp domain-containing protein [Desulfobacterales bacterium]